MTIADLIKRVETATGPDRDIDEETWCVVFAPDAVVVDFGIKFPAYTASVDAVIGLIGEKMGVDEAEWFVARDIDKPVRAGVRGHTSMPFDYGIGLAPTPALALLLAFLRAWEQRDG